MGILPTSEILKMLKRMHYSPPAVPRGSAEFRSSHQARRWKSLFATAAIGLIAGANVGQAESVRVGGPMFPGHARPPLHVNVTPATSVYYSPSQIRHAYGVDKLSVSGTGQTIAIIDAYGSSSMQRDLNTFCSYFGLPAITVPIYYPQGRPGGNTGWAQETALDVEWAHAIAPTARIVLVVAKTASLANLLGAVDYAVNNLGATVVSMSWGGSESSSETSSDSHFNKPGVTFVASSGDSGESNGVEYPAASPYVLSVGGTSLYLDANNNRTNETGWSGSVGGLSVVESLPAFQNGWLAGSARGVPDVSYVADPNTGVEVVYGGRLYIFGGTSVGAPQWAGLIALANSGRSSNLNPASMAVYSVASGGVDIINSTNLLDITSGSNGSDTDDSAVDGYDLVTGLGSPVGTGLIQALINH
jgi:subtilase family serine protease